MWIVFQKKQELSWPQKNNNNTTIGMIINSSSSTVWLAGQREMALTCRVNLHTWTAISPLLGSSISSGARLHIRLNNIIFVFRTKKKEEKFNSALDEDNFTHRLEKGRAKRWPLCLPWINIDIKTKRNFPPPLNHVLKRKRFTGDGKRPPPQQQSIINSSKIKPRA